MSEIPTTIYVEGGAPPNLSGDSEKRPPLQVDVT